MEVAMCGSCSGGVRVQGSCCVGDLRCEGFTEYACYSVLLCIGIVVCGSCGVWELQCGRVALWWSQCAWGSWWLPKPNSLCF